MIIIIIVIIILADSIDRGDWPTFDDVALHQPRHNPMRRIPSHSNWRTALSNCDTVRLRWRANPPGDVTSKISFAVHLVIQTIAAVKAF